jgi:Lanthionine synthetase C-like protein/HopA1 effector protein family
MPPYSEQLDSALRVTAIHSATSWSWFWTRQSLVAPSLRRALSAHTVRAQLVRVISDALYRDFYRHGVARPADSEPAQSSPAATRAAFIAELSAANHGAGYVDAGWTVVGCDEALHIRKHGLTCHVYGDELVAAAERPDTGTDVGWRMPKELRAASPGFYLAMGDAPLSSAEHSPIVRWYWNVRADDAPEFVATITDAFNDARLPFRLKVVDDPSRFDRCDSAVLYTAGRDGARVCTLLQALYPGLAPGLKPGTPAFTKPVAVGVGVAEDPGRGESFGGHRCGVLAEGMVRAFEAGRTSLPERLSVVRACFAAHGISLEAPYARRGAAELVGLSLRAASRRARAPRAGPGGDALLETAAAIAHLLADDAIWHRGRCNWLGLGPAQDRGRGDVSGGLVYQALGPDLYAGTSGVALFLAETHAVTGEAVLRNAALGAIRQSLAAARAPSGPRGRGLYDGAGGIALAAACVGRLLGEDTLLRDAARLVRLLARSASPAPCADLISGDAGAIVALLALSDLLEDDELAARAVALGGALERTAEPGPRGCAWPSPAFPGQRPLLGLSHGTAGIAHALLELYRATGDTRHRDLACDAMEYERGWYDAAARNWPDFRGVPARASRRSCPVPLPAFWCHGAAGIALSRLHAQSILGDNATRAEALTALTTTRAWTEQMLADGTAGFSLCHGLAGNADVLATGARRLGGATADGAQVAINVAAAGVERHARVGHRWPLEPLGSRAPGLMLGLSGVGHFYLRLHDPEIPSVLLPNCEALTRRWRHAR